MEDVNRVKGWYLHGWQLHVSTDVVVHARISFKPTLIATNEGAGPRSSPYIIPTVLTVTHSLHIANLRPNGDHDRIQTTSFQQMGRSFKRSSDLYPAVIKDRHRVLTLGFALQNTHKTRKRTDELETLHSEYTWTFGLATSGRKMH